MVAMLLGWAPLAGQGNDRVGADVDFLKEPSGTVLARLSRGAAITLGPERQGWREATLTGWVETRALREDDREGFEVAINIGAGSPVRTEPAAGASIRAMAKAGALFDKIGTRGDWTEVRRTGWIITSAGIPSTQTIDRNAPQQAPLDTTAELSIPGGTSLAAEAGGSPIAELEVSRRAELVRRQDGWSLVRIEAWVRDGALSNAPPTDRITAQQIRDDPERYKGETVEWSLQVLAVQSADELRPELPPGQPYVLTRGPLPEAGFVYLVVTAQQAAEFRSMEPLAEVRIRGTVRAGRTRFLPTPVIDLVRRLD